MASVSPNSNTFLREVHPCTIPKECTEHISLHKVIILHFPPFNTLKALPCVLIIKSISPCLQNCSSIIYIFFTFNLPNVPSRITPAEASQQKLLCPYQTTPRIVLKVSSLLLELGETKADRISVFCASLAVTCCKVSK